MPECAIGLMVKYPVLGRVKTRLAAQIGKPEALEVYRRLLDNAVRVTDGLKREDYFRTVFITPPEMVGEFTELYPKLDAWHPQAGQDLGERMYNALAQLLAMDTIGRGILIGADIPEITGELIGEADRQLRGNDLVLGPTNDGGYYLIGMKHVHAGLFASVDWGTDRVFSQTITVAESSKLSTFVLPELRDLDDAEDFKHFTSRGVLK